jgi:hypothetical protein
MNVKNTLAKSVLLVCFIPLLILSIYCGFKVHQLSIERANIKKDYSDINSITYGLLSINVWKDNIEGIISDRVDDFELTPDQTKVIQEEINALLKKIILQSDSMIQNSHTLKGKIGKTTYNTFLGKKTLMEKTPEFSKDIVDEISKPTNKAKLKNLAEQKLQEYASQTFDSISDTTHLLSMLAKYHTQNIDDFNKAAQTRIDSLQRKTYKLTFAIMAILAIFLLSWVVVNRFENLQKLFFALSVLLALSVLIVGLSSPMIEIDARIKQMTFTLLGEHLQFKDQVLFYQSKSILQVVEILLRTGAIDSIFVGILILAFSIIFPITKLISTQIYLFGREQLRKNKFISFFALKSGKWSMADVMVVAIFMAYVGFKGILNNQLKGLNYNTPSLKGITTNLTSLQPAFILFLGFVLYGLALSEILKRIVHVKENKE